MLQQKIAEPWAGLTQVVQPCVGAYITHHHRPIFSVDLKLFPHISIWIRRVNDAVSLDLETAPCMPLAYTSAWGKSRCRTHADPGFLERLAPHPFSREGSIAFSFRHIGSQASLGRQRASAGKPRWAEDGCYLKLGKHNPHYEVRLVGSIRTRTHINIRMCIAAHHIHLEKLCLARGLYIYAPLRHIIAHRCVRITAQDKVDHFVFELLAPRTANTLDHRSSIPPTNTGE